jgi:predicted RNA binding protein YcfA (HicA-like mRNA interferase family)
MTKLPVVKHQQIIKVAKKLGFLKDHQKGSHLVMRNLQTKQRVVIPIHKARTIKKGTLTGILKDLEINKEEFINLLK